MVRTTWLRSVLMMLTLAFATAAPLGSRTVPPMEPETSCANSATPLHNSSSRHTTALLIRLPPKSKTIGVYRTANKGRRGARYRESSELVRARRFFDRREGADELSR